MDSNAFAWWMFGCLTGLTVAYFALLAYARVTAGPARARPMRFDAFQRATIADAVTVARKIGDPPGRAIGYVPNDTRIISDWRPQGPQRRIEQAYSFRVAVYGQPARTVLLPSRYLARFISLPEPARKLWWGKYTALTDCFLVASARGWIDDRDDGNGWQWAHDMRTLARRVRKLEAEEIYLPPPARAGEDTD